jgi:NADH dehydrogenase/NADH:ubiquinone oxidoreductase subunit G
LHALAESDRAHQRQLAEALETQRQAMEQARNHALEKAEQGWAQQLAQVRGQAEELEKKHEKKLEQTHEALAASKQREHALQLKLQTRESELKTQARVHMEKQAHQTAVIDEKHQALEATRKAQRELIESIERQRVIETDDLEGRLRQLYRVTDEVTTALGNIQSLLDGIHMDAPDNEADD